MNNVAEITALFTELASRLQTDPSSITPSFISSFNESLNLDSNEQSQFRVLDKALSLMCFKAPEVFDAEVKCLVDTIVSVLSSCVSCEVLRFQKEEEFLRVGSLISSQNCAKLVETFLGIAQKLEGHVTLKQMLLSSVLRAAVSSSRYQGLFPFAPYLSLEVEESKIASVSECQHLFPEEALVHNHEVPLRLLLWYLDPLALKHDISNILREVVDRPFINLKKELHDRVAWCSIIICLVLSPIKFIEARNLLHSWFLMTGLASMIELKSKLLSSILDVLAQPTLWSISMKVGSKLPFSDAYFPQDHHLVSVLAGPISGESFIGLVHHIGGSSVTGKHTCPCFKEDSTWTKMINHKSTWSTLMAFPEWFLFASILFFSKKDSQSDFSLRCMSSAMKTEQSFDAEQYCAAAARYLAYSIFPICEAHLDRLVKSLIQMSESWTSKQLSSHKNKVTSGRFKNFRRPRMISDTACKEENGMALRLWLEGFHDCHTKHLTDITKSCTSKGAKPKNNNTPQKDIFFRRIPLGIFIESTNLDEEGCELLLQYAATGEIPQSAEAEEIQELNWTEDVATAGACLVFDLYEVVESISSAIFDSDDSEYRFVSQLKRKATGFMVKCIRKLNHFTVSGSCKTSTLKDLHDRLQEWCHQGGEIIQGLEPLRDALSALKV